MTPLTAEQAALIDTPHVVHGVDGQGNYLGLVPAVQAAAIAAGPPPAVGTWHWTAGRWERTFTLLEVKAERISAMREAREAAINGTFTWDGSTFDADQISQTRLLGVFIASQAPGWPGQGWRLADNTWRTLSAADVAAVWAALEAHMRGHFVTFALREASISAAATAAAVNVITWEA